MLIQGIGCRYGTAEKPNGMMRSHRAGSRRKPPAGDGEAVGGGHATRPQKLGPSS